VTRSSLLALAGGVAAASFALACLPADERPPPGRVTVTAAPSDATRDGFTTDDGWTVRFDRFVAGLGDVDLDGVNERRDGVDEEETCNAYSETDYEWLIDFTAAGREKIGLVHGIGSCTIEVRLRGPSADTVLGAGATEVDLELMRVEEVDPWTEIDDEDEGEEIAVLARGTAHRGDETRQIDWIFRRSFEIRRCEASDGGGGDASRVELTREVEREIPLEVRAEELFRRHVADDAPLVFDRYASADADADGTITLEELDRVPVPPEVLPIPEPPGGADEGDDIPEPESLGDYVVLVLLPRVVRVAGSGPCRTEAR
jgi:hypothetical protein